MQSIGRRKGTKATVEWPSVHDVLACTAPQPGDTGGAGGGHGKPLTSTWSHGGGNEGERRQQRGQPWRETLPQTLAMPLAVVLAAWNGDGLLKACMAESTAMLTGGIRNGAQEVTEGLKDGTEHVGCLQH